MAGDRDLAVAAVRALYPGARRTRSGWEMTSATGARGLRLVNETDAFRSFLLTEANPNAFAVLQLNASRYPGTEAVEADCRALPGAAPFDYVDLDPYGSPTPFVPTALRAVREGGVLAVTATDMMVLAGAQPAACRRKYSAEPVRGRLGPEGGLRILLAHLALRAQTLGRSARPVLAYARDHYVRAYVEVGTGQSVGRPPVGFVVPDAWSGPRVGAHGPYGPMWLGPLFDRALVQRLELPPHPAEPAELEVFLRRVREEAEVDRAFYYEANVLASQLKLAEPPSLERLRSALAAAGYRTARTHARPEGFRTDAPRTVVEATARAMASVR